MDGRTIKNLIPIDVVKAGNIQIDGQSYSILGTISHIGTAEAGHNRAYVKTGSMWYCCEDYRLPFPKDPIDTEVEQNYCLILKKSTLDNEEQQISLLQHSTTDGLHQDEHIGGTDHKQNLKRSRSAESSDSSKEYSKTVCVGCNKSFSRLLGHIQKSKCKDSYDMDKLNLEIELARDSSYRAVLLK